MKSVRRNSNFEKHFRKRIAPNKKLVEQFEKRLALFVAGERGYPLYDHPLAGLLTGKRSFSINADVRVIYEESGKAIIFLDIGTHNQVY